jgi:hypothetical protein
MVVVINGKVHPLKEDDYLELYESTSPPTSQRVISSGTFAANLILLADYLEAK